MSGAPAQRWPAEQVPAVVLHKLGLCRAQVEMLHAPGALLIELQGEKVFMQGPAEYVYQAELMA